MVTTNMYKSPEVERKDEVGKVRKEGNKRSAIPFCSNALHGSAHERVSLEHSVEVSDRQREHVAVGLSAHARHATRVRQQTNLPKVGPVAVKETTSKQQ